MFYHLLYPLYDTISVFNVMKYITVRTFFASFIAMSVYFLLGRPFIAFLSKKQFWQTVRSDGPVTHMDKRGTPTMGGVLIWIAFAIALLLCGRFDEPTVILGCLLLLAFSIIGFIDDYRKVVLRDAKGLRARWKFPLQVIIATIVMLILVDGFHIQSTLSFPFVKTFQPDLHWWYIPFGVCVIVGASNAVNLTDGLDGLVSVPSMIAFFAYGIFAYVAGHKAIAEYLQIPWIPGSGELTVLCGAIVGALIGFLWFNAHPASVFMGDVGSLPLGALLGYVSIITKHELLLLVVGGIFVLETVSVMTQVISFKLTGKRLFRMAPLHHHFELKGWAESKVIVRFWIIAMVLAFASLATLKLR